MFHHLAPVYFRASSRIDYTDRNRRKLSNEVPLFSDTQISSSDYTLAQPLMSDVETQALEQRVAHWAPQVATGRVSAEWAAAESAGFVAYPETNTAKLEDLSRLAFAMLTAAA